MKTIIKLSLIAIIVLLVSACGFRKHEIAAINKATEATVQSIIAMNTPACNPNIADCGLITGGY